MFYFATIDGNSLTLMVHAKHSDVMPEKYCFNYSDLIFVSHEACLITDHVYVSTMKYLES
jgi:hypothetical protein